MENYLVFGILALTIGLIGYLLGRKLEGLKNKVKSNDLKNHISTTQAQLQEVKKQQNETIKRHELDIKKLDNKFEKEISSYKLEIKSIRQEKDYHQNKLTQTQTDYKNLQETAKKEKVEIERIQERFQDEFENLAGKILEQKSDKFTQLNKTNIENILSPLQQKIKDFEEKVEKSRESSIQHHAELGKQLEHLNQQNLKISEEASNLTNALKGDSKMQGDWGEMILERVLEQSGLEKDREYFTQKSFNTAHNTRLQPDVIVSLPENKKLIIDAKVSLKAYESYINTTEEVEKYSFLKQHLISIKNHVDNLSEKEYQKLYSMTSPDFVLLFIPIEAAFAIASHKQPNLYARAFDKNIIIVTPTTLLAVLRTIDSMWQNQKQKENTIEIATQAGRLYDSFVNLLRDLEKLGKQFTTAQNTYDVVMKKLNGRGNLIGRIEKLKKMGAKASKQIDDNYIDNNKSLNT